MKMTGHLTESVYRRYAIVDAVMLREAAARLDALQLSDHREPVKLIEGPTDSAEQPKFSPSSAQVREVAYRRSARPREKTLNYQWRRGEGVEPSSDNISRQAGFEDR